MDEVQQRESCERERERREKTDQRENTSKDIWRQKNMKPNFPTCEIDKYFSLGANKGQVR